MRFNQTATEISRVGQSERKGFQIKASAQAFRILSDGLYSDKVKAIIRELGSNAWDAHIAAGSTSRPFDVHLPNKIEPWYAIRDYGTGLPHDKVMGLYSTYFDSTKDDSNDFTGAMGLGSKSPFSYTDAFTVTSFYNGEKRIYMIDIGSDGVPQVGLVDGSPFKTTEDNGLEIKLAVKSDDFYDFERKALEVFKRYPLVPNVVGTESFQIEQIEYEFEGKNWRMPKGGRGQSYAIQGTVAYPIRTSNLQGVDYDKRNLLDSAGFELDFDIGELEVSASREDLGYDERTSKNIIARFEEALADLTKKANEKFANFECHWDAAAELYGITSNWSNGLNRLISNRSIKPLYNGQEIDTSPIRIETTADLQFTSYEVGHYSSRRVARNYKPDLHRSYLTFRPAKNVRFAYDDLKKGGLARFKHYVDNDTTNCTWYLIREADAAGLAEFRKLLKYGKNVIPTTSSMPKPPPAARAARGVVDKSTADLSYFTGNTSTKKDRWELNLAVELDEIEYTFDVYQGDLDIYDTYKSSFASGYTYGSMCPKEVWSLAKSLGIIDDDTAVYGIPRTYRTRMKQYGPQAKDLVDVVSKYIKKNMKTLESDVQKVTDAIAFRSKLGWKFGNLIKPFALCNEEGIGGKEVKAFFKLFGDQSASEEWLYDIQRGAKMFNITMPKPTDGNVLHDKWKAMANRYPMMHYFENVNSLYDEDKTRIRDYIALVDGME